MMTKQNRPVQVVIRGIPAKLVLDKVRKADRKEGLHYYDVRHSDTDFDYPDHILERAVTNHWATLIMETPLALERDGKTVLTRDESDYLLAAASQLPANDAGFFVSS